MGLTDVLFGRKKLAKAQQEKLFAISTARITLETELGLKPTGDAAVVFKPLSAAEFVRAENELQELLDSVAQESHSKIERRGDEFGFEWLIVRDNDFEELVAGVHLVASELAAHGFGEQLLAAAFKFSGGGAPGLLHLRLQAGRVLAVRPEGRRQGARQLRGARAEGEAREGAADRAGPDALAGPVRRADLG